MNTFSTSMLPSSEIALERQLGKSGQIVEHSCYENETGVVIIPYQIPTQIFGQLWQVNDFPVDVIFIRRTLTTLICTFTTHAETFHFGRTVTHFSLLCNPLQFQFHLEHQMRTLVYVRKCLPNVCQRKCLHLYYLFTSAGMQS